MKGKIIKILAAGILGAAGITALYMGALWQLEIIMIDVENKWPYGLPFKFGASFDYCFWRDVWSSVLAIALIAACILFFGLGFYIGRLSGRNDHNIKGEIGYSGYGVVDV